MCWTSEWMNEFIGTLHPVTWNALYILHRLLFRPHSHYTTKWDSHFKDTGNQVKSSAFHNWASPKQRDPTRCALCPCSLLLCFLGLLDLQGQFRHALVYAASCPTLARHPVESAWFPIPPPNSWVDLGKLLHSSKKLLNLKSGENNSICLVRLL